MSALDSNSPNAVRIVTNDETGEAGTNYFSHPFKASTRQVAIWTGQGYGTETVTLGDGIIFTPGYWLDDIEDGTWVHGKLEIGVSTAIQTAIDNAIAAIVTP